MDENRKREEANASINTNACRERDRQSRNPLQEEDFYRALRRENCRLYISPGCDPVMGDKRAKQ